ncbi:MAG: phosphate ABC transporter ATP-binding protein [Fretibacterium sp.]|nr:phosphate ABC transporter ATP-binding protein [Fretibacterium sp.]
MTECAVIKGLRVAFGEREILHGIDAAFPANRVSVILGRSGSGKSTLLRSLNRLNECFDGCRSEGEVRVLLDGRLVPVEGGGAPALTELRRRVGMVFQSPNPLPLSIRRNITLPLELAAGRLSREELDETVRETLTRTGLWEEVQDRLDAPAQGLSGGQQQRLCLARALALRPSLLLLDEPTASLDRAAAQRVEDMIKTFNHSRQGADLTLEKRPSSPPVSIIMVSHSLQQAAKLADYAVVMADGQVLQTFANEELRAALEDGSLVKMAF